MGVCPLLQDFMPYNNYSIALSKPNNVVRHWQFKDTSVSGTKAVVVYYYFYGGCLPLGEGIRHRL